MALDFCKKFKSKEQSFIKIGNYNFCVPFSNGKKNFI